MHFSTEDLITDRSVELLKYPYRRRLKSNGKLLWFYTDKLTVKLNEKIKKNVKNNVFIQNFYLKFCLLGSR